MSLPSLIAVGLSEALIDWPETRMCRPTRLPAASSPAVRRHCEIGRKKSCASILLAAPDQLHRRVGKALGDRDRLVDVVLRAAAAAECAAEVVLVDLAF